MANKFKAALFASRIHVNNSNGQVSVQDSITLVAETSATKQFAAVSFAIESVAQDSFTNLRILHSTNALVGANQDSEFTDILNKICKCTAIVSQISLSSNICKVELLEKLDLFFYEKVISNIFNRPYKLNDKDTNGQKLIDFLKLHFDFLESDIKDFKVSNQNALRKFAAQKRIVDYDLFWSSPYITDAEKDYCRALGDLDIIMSNSSKDIFKINRRLLHVQYPERSWILNILFGDPSSGKTTFIESLAWLEGAPFVKITGDPTISMTKLIMTVGPENVQKTLTKQDYIDKCKSFGLSDEEVKSLSNKINEMILSSKEVDIQLTQQESIILKSIKHNLPLIVLLDEVNLFTTLLMATLADVITSGYVNVGVHTYKDNGHNVMWFGAYNPDTYKCSPFEGKFRDRALFFCSEMPTQEQLISHKQRKIRASLFGTSSVMSCLQEQLDDVCSSHPEKEEEFRKMFGLLSNVCNSITPSSDSIQWFFDFKVEEILGTNVPSFKEGEFSDYYVTDCQLDTPNNIDKAVERIIILKDKINEHLKFLTKGIDSKNPNSNFSFYIPNRAVDYFIDLIFCFSSVQKAVEFIVYNLIPNGDTVRYNSSANPAKDIANSIVSSLAEDIADLQQFLFTNVNDLEMLNQCAKVYCTKYDGQCWVGDSDSIDLTESNVNSQVNTSDDILDEAEDLLV